MRPGILASSRDDLGCPSAIEGRFEKLVMNRPVPVSGIRIVHADERASSIG